MFASCTPLYFTSSLISRHLRPPLLRRAPLPTRLRHRFTAMLIPTAVHFETEEAQQAAALLCDYERERCVVCAE